NCFGPIRRGLDVARSDPASQPLALKLAANLLRDTSVLVHVTDEDELAHGSLGGFELPARGVGSAKSIFQGPVELGAYTSSRPVAAWCPGLAPPGSAVRLEDGRVEWVEAAKVGPELGGEPRRRHVPPEPVVGVVPDRGSRRPRARLPEAARGLGSKSLL